MSLNKLTHPNLLKGSILKSLVLFSLPLLISFIFQQLYSSVDTIIIGHYLREESLAAVGASAPIFDLLVGFGTGFGGGLSIVAARSFGAKDEEKLKKIVTSSLIITLFVTLIISLITKFFLKDIIVLLGTPEELSENAFSYISVIAFSCGVLFLYNLLSGLLRAIGNSFTPLIFLVLSSILNIFLDIILMTRLNLGIRGAAIATAIAQGISAVLCLIYIFKKARVLVPSKKHFVFEKQIYKELVSQGLSMALMGSIVQSGSVILQSAINLFGKYTIAGHIAARKIFALTSIPSLTLATAAATFVSQNRGANQIDRIKKGIRCGILMNIAWVAFLLISITFFIKNIVIFISGSENEEIVSYATKYIMFMIPFYSVLGGVLIIRNSLQGFGYKVIPLVSSIIELLGKILFTKLIIPHIGSWGVILCEPLIWVVMFMQLAYVYWRRIGKKIF